MLSVLFRKLRLVYDKCIENCAGLDPVPSEVSVDVLEYAQLCVHANAFLFVAVVFWKHSITVQGQSRDFLLKFISMVSVCQFVLRTCQQVSLRIILKVESLEIGVLSLCFFFVHSQIKHIMERELK